jgi:hypothetical protein
MAKVSGSGTRDKPWMLKTPSGSSEFQMYRDEAANPPVLVCVVGKTELRYYLRCIEDLHAMLKAHGDWMLLGSADEQKPAAAGTVESWGRSPDNPVKGWYGLKKGLRGRFGMYVPPLLEALGLAEVEHNPKNNRMRALWSGVGRGARTCRRVNDVRPPPSAAGFRFAASSPLSSPGIVSR